MSELAEWFQEQIETAIANIIENDPVGAEDYNDYEDDDSTDDETDDEEDKYLAEFGQSSCCSRYRSRKRLIVIVTIWMTISESLSQITSF